MSSSLAALGAWGFLGGGGGGFFFASRLPVESTQSACGIIPSLAPSLPNLPPYLSFNLFASFRPAATWSPCLWRKLFAVEAAARASDSDTEPGFSRNVAAVLSAAFFCSNVVPSTGGRATPVPGPDADVDADVAGIPSRGNREDNSPIWALDDIDRVGGGGGALPLADWLVAPVLIPNPGTEIPAALSRFIAPWFRRPEEVGFLAWTDEARAGGGAGFRGGNIGGKLGRVGLEELGRRGGGCISRRGGGRGGCDIGSRLVSAREELGGASGSPIVEAFVG